MIVCIRVVHPGDELSENSRNPGDNLGKFCNPGRFCTSMIHSVYVSSFPFLSTHYSCALSLPIMLGTSDLNSEDL